MGATKSLGCVEMKAALQARLLKEMEGMTDEEQRAYTQRKLRESDCPAGRLWREVIAKRDTGT